MTRKAICKQMAYLRRDLDAIDGKLSLGKNLPPRQTERLGTIRAVYEQQTSRSRFPNNCVTETLIVGLSETFG